MFGRKKEAGKRKGGGEALMAQMGMLDDMGDLSSMTNMEAMLYGDVENDAELEAELAALQAEDEPSSKKSPKKVVPLDQLGAMIEQSMKDIPDDEDLSDTEDPDLLSELEGLTEGESKLSVPNAAPQPPSPVPGSSGADTVSVLKDRLQMYQAAMQAAKTEGQGSKVRRMERGIKTLNELLRKAKSGRPVADDDIPPPVSSGSAKSSPLTSPDEPPKPSPVPVYEPTTSGSIGPTSQPAPPRPAPPTPQSTAPAQPPPRPPARQISGPNAETRAMLVTRRDQYKLAASRAKQSGYGDMALKNFRIAKQFDKVIQALDEGKPVDLSQMPPPPPGYSKEAQSSSTVATSSMERSSMQGAAAAAAPQQEEPEMSQIEQAKVFNAPTEAKTVMEALQQRLEKYKQTSDEAKKSGNNSKARRFGRIVKQYEDAIKTHKAGKPLNLDELPTPPGFPPFPSERGSAAPPKSAAGPDLDELLAIKEVKDEDIEKEEAAAVQPHPQPSASHQAGPPPTKRPQLQKQTSLLSRAEQQTIFLQERQLQFKKAAFKAKNNGDIELAKKYLRMAKGFDNMIVAAQSGLPVNMAQVPSAPGMDSEEGWEFVESSPGTDDKAPQGDREQMYKKLQEELIQQIRTSTENADHFTHLGDVSSASKFDRICQNARKDLDALKNAYKHGDPVPRFHYETKTFSLVQSNTDLGDNDLEIQLVRGINLALPSDYSEKDLDTYVKYEFPYPNDDPQKGASETVKSTNSPEYNQSFKIQVARKSRAFLRLLKNKSIKLEIYYKRGFFKGDKLLGTASIKLLPLEQKCNVHDSYDLMDGRKAVGGKLEVKIRIRNPFVGSEVEEKKEKWLVIDHFDRKLDQPKQPSGSQGGGQQSKNVPVSMEVLKYEKQLLDRQIQTLQGKMTKSEEQALRHKSQLLQQKVETQRESLKKGGLSALSAYAKAIDATKGGYLQEAQHLVKQGNREKAQIMLNKKKLVEKEVEAIQAKIPR